MDRDPCSILIVGSGGREHALAWKLSQSPLLRHLYFAGGDNAGLEILAERITVDIGDHGAVVAACLQYAIDLVVIGPEAPLVAGLADSLRAGGIAAFGPSAAAARLEASKAFAKAFCAENGIPTAQFEVFTAREAALAHLAEVGAPCVIKADGLAAGKGVVVAETREEAEAAIAACFDGAFGAAGATVVIEEKLTGVEASFFAISDGLTVMPLVTAQDYKRAENGDRGPNTGGMGALSPAPAMTPEMVRAAMDRILRPTIRGMAERGTPFTGVLYAGLMITEDGPQLIEFNVRFGDPECQVLMLRLESDLIRLLTAAVEGRLEEEPPAWTGDAALAVVLASKGYPGRYETGTPIAGLAPLGDDGLVVFHAATAERGGEFVATGGRVLTVAARAATAATARAKAYDAIGRINWPGGFWRTDIGAAPSD